jgi:hypothetical protein
MKNAVGLTTADDMMLITLMQDRVVGDMNEADGVALGRSIICSAVRLIQTIL